MRVMNRAGKVVALSALGIGVMAMIVGCTVKSTKLFEGSPTSESQAWQTGDELHIGSPNGDIVVDTVSGEEVTATVVPFVLLAHDATDEEARDELEKLELQVDWEEIDTDTGSGVRITVDLDRLGTVKSSLGGDLDVEIPSAFDGALRIEHDNGRTEIKDPGDAWYVGVQSDNGSCDVNVGSARRVVVACGNGSLSGSVASVPADFESAEFVTQNGDIELNFPSSGVFSVSAYSEGGGIVDVGNAESAGCTVEASAESSKTISCGGATDQDPVYTVNAEGNLAHDITLQF